ncbi:MAG: anhydro-N-acetylmuramic acid kinase [Betaproteobacteria bacterium]|jgi:anhydro-N-acetylmuramic acid kinase|nr:anhydro-N-acetylmuramic acid kinase [Betaproteobacteria bacterium]
MPGLFIGLMSGTSLDGTDAVLFGGAANPRVLGHVHQPFSPQLRESLLALNAPGENELHRAALAGNALALAYAAAVSKLLEVTEQTASGIEAIGCHGQTVRHQPQSGYTLQLVNAALLAELTGIRIACDFRSRDIAAGGEGAPLVPAFHQAVFASALHSRAVINIGGIANITTLPRSGEVTGFDCGPGNVLMDGWIARHRSERYDRGGAWAACGRVLPALAARMLAHDFFGRRPPKSTGRETFNLHWLESLLSGNEAPADVQATLCEVTAAGIAGAVDGYCPDALQIYLCGGGARNDLLRSRLAALLPGRTVGITDSLGIAAESVEGAAFAWLAQRVLLHLPGNLPAVTGASGPRVLGAVYPA